MTEIILVYFAVPLLSLLVLFVIFSPLKRCFPAKVQKLLRPGWLTDLSYFLGQYILFGSLVFGVLAALAPWLGLLGPEAVTGFVAAQPWWLQVLMVVFLSDLLIYWGHRLQHRAPLLWRFHAVHHSAEHLDWLAAHREHPLDTIYTVGLINLPAFILGFDLATLAGFTAFRGMWAVYIHSNVRLPLGPLRVLVGAPELHHWHHAKDRFAGNYANLSPVMDVLFGTYRHPNHEPGELGITQPFPKTYLAQLLHPFARRRRSRNSSETTTRTDRGTS